jgi:hypothetical protein
MAKKNSHTIRGTAHWAKVLGDPVPNYSGDNREWTIDLTPDEDGLAKLKELGIEDRLKNKDDDRGDFIQFRQREKRMDGSLNKRINVVDAAGEAWPQDKLIGNGSVVDVRFDYRDYGAGKKPGVYPQAIRVLEHAEYQRVDFAPLHEDDPYAKPAAKPEGHIEGFDPEDDFPE